MSTTLECQACGGKIGMNAEKCIHCGEPNLQAEAHEEVTQEPEKKPRTLLIAFLLITIYLSPFALYMMYKRKNWLRPIGLTSAMALATVIVFNINQTPTNSSLASQQNKEVSDLSYFQIRDNLKSMTEAQFNDYARSLNVTRVKWAGYVDNVDEGLLGGYTVWIDMDNNNSLLSVQDVYFKVPADKAKDLRKGSQITVEGDIASVIGLLETTAQVDLKAVSYWGGS